MKRNLIILTLIALTLSACKKSGTVAPSNVRQDSVPNLGTSTNGSLSGTITPAAAAGNVTATAIISGKPETFQVKPDNNGNFLFNSAPAGTYTVTVGAKEDFMSPEKLIFVIKPEQATSAGIIILTKKEYGTITGTVSPVAAAQQIQAVSVTSGLIVARATPDQSTGQFKIKDLLVGEYRIGLMPASGFVAPATQNLIVSKDQNTVAGIYNFTSIGLISTLKFKAGLSDRSMKGTASFVNGNLDLSGSLITSSSIARVSGTRYTLALKLENVNGAGTYTCNASTNSKLSYTISQVMGGVFYSTQKDGGNATVVITEIDQVNGTISGTFSGTIVSSSIAANPLKPVEITNGVFKAAFR